MIVLGLTGEIAAGKSTVAKELQRLGAVIIDADQLGHQVLAMPAVRDMLRARWGAEILDASGHVDRRAVANRVFVDPPDGDRQRAFLESVTHPFIARRAHAELNALNTHDGPAATVLDAALLFEAGWERFCDKTVFVRATAAIRWSRARQRGWTREQFTARQEAQMAGRAKEQLADIIIDNSGDLQQLAERVRRVWEDVVGRS